MDRVSIIIPVFNGSNYLAEAIRSGLAQTHNNIEVIVVNDGSNDEGRTEQIANSFGRAIRYFSKENGGVSSALNAGIREASGDWIAWLSHDDVFSTGKIEKQLRHLKNVPTADVCYTDYYVIDNDGAEQGQLKMPSFHREAQLRHLFQCMFICGSTTLVRRTVFDLVGTFDESLKYAQDADMWLRLAAATEFTHVPEPLIGWRYHAAQGSKNEKRMLADRHNYLRACINRSGCSDFFPKIADKIPPHIIRAKINLYLATVLLKCHREPQLASILYVRSIREWASLRNIAVYSYLFHTFVGWIYYKVGRKLAGFKRKYFPTHHNIPPVNFIVSSSIVESPFKGISFE